METYLRKYGAVAKIPFSLRNYFTGEFHNTAFDADGDVKISKNGGAFVNADDAQPTKVATNLFEIDLIAGEMEAARIRIHIIDQTSPKAYSDREIHIETYGHATSAQMVSDLDALVTLTATGLTVGGNWTYTKLMKVMAAFEAGKWRDKSGSPGVLEVLDPDNDSTVVLEITPSTVSPYRTVVVKI